MSLNPLQSRSLNKFKIKLSYMGEMEYIGKN
jgi:hypothetical protein